MYKDNTTDMQKHSAAHVIAMAVSRVYKGTKIGIGPVTKEGFYYDVDVSQVIDSKAIIQIETEINNILQQNLQFQQLILPRDQAMNLLLQRGQIYKAELINSIPDPEISLYKTGDEFIDLCRGPHVASTNLIGIVKVIKVENSFWNEDVNRAKLQRVYGMVFDTLDNYNEYLQLQNDLKFKNYKATSIKKRLAIKAEENIHYTDRGTILFKRICEIITKQLFNDNFNLKQVELTTIFNNEVEADTVLNKMAQLKNASYRDLPLAYLSKYLTRSLSFISNGQEFTNLSFKYYFLESDAITHIVKQLENSIKVFKKLDIDFTSDINSDDFDHIYIQTISNILQKNLISHTKIITPPNDDVELIFKTKDRFGKEWSLGFIKLKKLETFNGKNIISISFNFIISELWKFIIEKYEGILPHQLAITQVLCLPVSKEFNDFSSKIADFLNNNNFSSRVDKSSKSLKFKIWRAEEENIPIQLILGEKESLNNTVSARQNHINLGLVSLDNLLENLKAYVSNL